MRRVMPAYEECAVGWLEEPFPPQDRRAYAAADASHYRDEPVYVSNEMPTDVSPPMKLTPARTAVSTGRTIMVSQA